MRAAGHPDRLCVARASATGRPGRHGSYQHGSSAHACRHRCSWDHDHSAAHNHYGAAGDRPYEHDDHVAIGHHRSAHHDSPGSRQPIHGGHRARRVAGRLPVTRGLGGLVVSLQPGPYEGERMVLVLDEQDD